MPSRDFGVYPENTTPSSSRSDLSRKRKPPEGSFTDPIIVEDHDEGPCLANYPNVLDQTQDVIVIEDDNPIPPNQSAPSSHGTQVENRNVRLRTSLVGNPSPSTMSAGHQGLEFESQQHVLITGNQWQAPLVPMHVLNVPVTSAYPYNIIQGDNGYAGNTMIVIPQQNGGNAFGNPNGDVGLGMSGPHFLPPAIEDAMTFILNRAPELQPKVDVVVQAFIDGGVSMGETLCLLDYLRNCAMILGMGNNDNEDDEEEGDYVDMDPDDLTYEASQWIYQEVLSLAEQAGDANTGLSEEGFEMRIKEYRYKAPQNIFQEDMECCPICLEDFGSEDKIGELDCGHKFHFQCVKQWLLKKNVCPICKRTALEEP